MMRFVCVCEWIYIYMDFCVFNSEFVFNMLSEWMIAIAWVGQAKCLHIYVRRIVFAFKWFVCRERSSYGFILRSIDRRNNRKQYLDRWMLHTRLDYGSLRICSHKANIYVYIYIRFEGGFNEEHIYYIIWLRLMVGFNELSRTQLVINLAYTTIRSRWMYTIWSTLQVFNYTLGNTSWIGCRKRLNSIDRFLTYFKVFNFFLNIYYFHTILLFIFNKI